MSVLVGVIKNYEGGDIHNISSYRNHPYFNLRTFDYDISVLTLSSEIIFNGWSKQRILLPNAGDPVRDNDALLTSGWGDTRNPEEDSTVLRAVILFASNQWQCHLKYLCKQPLKNI